jgi:hypothetical protein
LRFFEEAIHLHQSVDRLRSSKLLQSFLSHDCRQFLSQWLYIFRPSSKVEKCLHQLHSSSAPPHECNITSMGETYDHTGALNASDVELDNGGRQRVCVFPFFPHIFHPPLDEVVWSFEIIAIHSYETSLYRVINRSILSFSTSLFESTYPEHGAYKLLKSINMILEILGLFEKGGHKGPLPPCVFHQCRCSSDGAG